jgi:hypothetical protein
MPRFVSPRTEINKGLMRMVREDADQDVENDRNTDDTDGTDFH